MGRIRNIYSQHADCLPGPGSLDEIGKTCAWSNGRNHGGKRRQCKVYLLRDTRDASATYFHNQARETEFFGSGRSLRRESITKLAWDTNEWVHVLTPSFADAEFGWENR